MVVQRYAALGVGRADIGAGPAIFSVGELAIPMEQCARDLWQPMRTLGLSVATRDARGLSLALQQRTRPVEAGCTASQLRECKESQRAIGAVCACVKSSGT